MCSPHLTRGSGEQHRRYFGDLNPLNPTFDAVWPLWLDNSTTSLNNRESCRWHTAPVSSYMCGQSTQMRRWDPVFPQCWIIIDRQFSRHTHQRTVTNNQLSSVTCDLLRACKHNVNIHNRSSQKWTSNLVVVLKSSVIIIIIISCELHAILNRHRQNL